MDGGDERSEDGEVVEGKGEVGGEGVFGCVGRGRCTLVAELHREGEEKRGRRHRGRRRKGKRTVQRRLRQDHLLVNPQMHRHLLRLRIQMLPIKHIDPPLRSSLHSPRLRRGKYRRTRGRPGEKGEVLYCFVPVQRGAFLVHEDQAVGRDSKKGGEEVEPEFVQSAQGFHHQPVSGGKRGGGRGGRTSRYSESHPLSSQTLRHPTSARQRGWASESATVASLHRRAEGRG